MKLTVVDIGSYIMLRVMDNEVRNMNALNHNHGNK